MGIRKDLHPREIGKGRAEFLVACFSMKAHEKSIFWGVFRYVKLLDGSASNISNCVHATNNKISGYKSHDTHFMLHYLLPVAIQNTMPNIVVDPLIRFGLFFRSICQKIIQLQDLPRHHSLYVMFFLLFYFFFFYDWARLVRGLGLIRVEKGCPSFM